MRFPDALDILLYALAAALAIASVGGAVQCATRPSLEQIVAECAAKTHKPAECKMALEH